MPPHVPPPPPTVFMAHSIMLQIVPGSKVADMIQRYLPSPDILAAVCILLVLLWWWSTRSKGQRLPPGPTGIPFLGSALLFLDIQSLHIKLMDFVKKYGKIVRLKVGQKQMVLLNSADVIREAFVEKGEYFNERPAHLQWAKKANRHTGKLHDTST